MGMADHIGQTGTESLTIHGRDGDEVIVRTYRVTENANDRGMLRVEFTDEFVTMYGARGFVRASDHA